MSGLTPILDTLLHQVLGKRGDVLPGLSKPLNQPVGQVPETHVVRGSETETRPEPRFVKPVPGNLQGAARNALQRTAEGQLYKLIASSSSRLPQEDLEESVRTSLSASGKLISSLLREGGEQQPVIRQNRHISLAGDKLPTSEQLAQRLGDIIRQSGLFYESHLAKWYEGRMPTGELAREPQMKMAGELGPHFSLSKSAEGQLHQIRSLQQSHASQSQFPAGEREAPALRSRLAPNLPSNGPAVPVVSHTAEAEETSLASGRQHASDDGQTLLLQPSDARDKLAAIVRHQLELLGSPNIRWEGELVSGLFMMMEISLPEKREEASDGNASATEDETWGATLHIALPVLGNLTVSVKKADSELIVNIIAEQERTVSLLTEQVGIVEEKLHSGVIEKTRIDIRPARNRTDGL